MARRTKSKESDKSNATTSDIQFTFTGVHDITAVLNPLMYTEADIPAVADIIEVIRKEIVIDKTYVEFDGNPFEKTFMKESGWNELCDLVRETDFGKNMTPDQQQILSEAYQSMIICYINQVLSDMGYDLDGIRLAPQPSFGFDVAYSIDDIQEWKHYPGRWQKW